MKVYIYKLIDPINLNIRYIGKTINPKRRYKSHITKSKNSKTHCSLWINCLLKINLLPIMEIIEECNEENWEDKEKYWIKFYKNIYDLTNITPGGEGGFTNGRLNKPWSEQQRINNRKARLGLKVNHTKDGNEKRKQGLKNFYYKNRKPIIQCDLNMNPIKEWESSVIAAKALNTYHSNINKCCKDNTKTCKNFKWKYKE